jgi:uroporphyrinogen-III synthase
VAEPADGPLAGVGVVVTRADGDDEELTELLRARGAIVLRWPTVRWAPPVDAAPLEGALERIGAFDWVVFTSPRAVEAVAGWLPAWPDGVRLAAVGRATADAAARHHWPAALVPETQTAAALVAALAAEGVRPGSRVLFPASEIARDTLPAGLEALGVEVARVTAYRTLPAEVDAAACAAALEAGQVAVVSFASPSAVEGLRAALGDTLFARLAGDVVLAAIGPTTATALRAAGGRTVIEARDHSLAGLAERIAEWGRAHKGERRHGLSDS